MISVAAAQAGILHINSMKILNSHTFPELTSIRYTLYLTICLVIMSPDIMYNSGHIFDF